MPRISHSEEMQKRILDAFGQCLTNQKVSSISVRDIAATAGVPLGSIHYYFHNKTEILLSYFEGILEDCTAVIRTWREQLPTEISTLPEFLKHYQTLTHMCFKEDEGSIHYVRYYALLAEYKELQELCKKHTLNSAKELSLAIERTHLPCKDPLRLAQFLVSLWDGVSLHAELFVEDSNNYDLFDAFANMICKDEIR